jgi:hypothetical protein
MPEYQEIEDSLDIPKNTGIEGFLRTIKEILQLSRVQSININAKGRVSWRRFVLDGEQGVVGADFADLEPWGIIRNGDVTELPIVSTNAALVLAFMLDRAALEKLHPIAFVTGAETVFWDWYSDSTGQDLMAKDQVYGLPVYTDRHAPDTALILCIGYSRDAALIDTQKSYKIEMDYVLAPGQFVEVFGG